MPSAATVFKQTPVELDIVKFIEKILDLVKFIENLSFLSLVSLRSVKL